MSLLTAAWQRAWAPPDRRPIHEWAAEHMTLPGCYGIQGRFSAEQSRYLIEPLKALLDDHVRVVTIKAAIQTGKSMFAVWEASA